MAASAGAGSDFSDADTRSTPSRRHGDQTLSAAGVVGGSTLLPTAWPQLPGAPSARRTTSRPTTDAPSRGARWVRATRAHMGRPSARTAGEPMRRGRMPVLPRGRPACPPGVRGHHLLHAGREGPRPQRCSNTRPQLPRGRERRARWGPRRGSSPARRVWRSRRPEGGRSVCVLFIFCVSSFSFVWRIWGEDRGALLEPIFPGWDGIWLYQDTLVAAFGQRDK